MSANLRRFTRAVYGMDAVVRRVPDGGWDGESPCEGWTARQVVGHQVGVLNGVADFARGGAVHLPETPEDLGDPAGLWGRCRDDVLEALDHEGALQRHDDYWFGPMTIDELLGVVQWDPLTHAWDLARATGQQHVPDHELAESSIATIQPMAATLRKWRLIGDPVDVPAGATPMDRFLGLVGRDPTA
jgi:uncharacterized protein (TIGR03086 family)